MAARRYAFRFWLICLVALALNGLSVHHAWFAAGCADCMESAGVPFTFIQHGGFFTHTSVNWYGAFGDVMTILGVAIVCTRINRRAAAPVLVILVLYLTLGVLAELSAAGGMALIHLLAFLVLLALTWTVLTRLRQRVE
jgi:hypothetical protein